MNIITFVMTLLIIVGILTYARVESFKNTMMVETLFEKYMDTQERKFLNDKNKSFYKNTIASQKDKKKDEQENAIPADSKLNFRLFINKEERKRKESEFLQYYLIARNLIYYLYHETKFYQEAQELVPDLAGQVLDGLILASEELSKEQIPSCPKDFATITIRNPVVNEVFYKMLKGTKVKDKKKDGENTWAHFLPKEGYLSLLDFISSKDKPTIRIFLASPQLLMAIFGDEKTVNEILDVRKKLYKRLSNDNNLKPEELQPELEIFKNRVDPGISSAMLNFKISKTNPADYE